MLKNINIITLVLILSTSLAHAAETNSREFPKTWEELVGSENLGMLFVGNSKVHNKTEAYVANISADHNVFETIQNPYAPEKFQKYQLTQEGLFYNLKLNQHKHMQGKLDKFEKQESQDEITWIFKGIYQGEGYYKGQEVVHQFMIRKETGAMMIKTSLGGHRHAEVELIPRSRSASHTNNMRSALVNTIVGK